MRSTWISLCALCVMVYGSHALAQATLTGTFIRYLTIGADGRMIGNVDAGEACPTGSCTAPNAFCDSGTMECFIGESMMYGETASDPTSCDLYFPGSPVEGFSIQATGSDGTALEWFNTTGDTQVVAMSGPTVTGRSITWSGQAMSGTEGLLVEQSHAYEMADRLVHVTIRLTNAGAGTLTDVYYLRNGNPDLGECNIGTDYSTENDVRAQPPGDGLALITAGGGDRSTPANFLVVGVGSYDARARVYGGGFENTDGATEWMDPIDPGGALVDEAVDIIFHQPSLAPGANTTFELYYVWGATVDDVEARFEALVLPASPCTTEGSACMIGTSGGVCHASNCCTGCWDGARCHLGQTSSACGLAGGACTSCTDTNPCSIDTCSLGVCGNPSSPAGTFCDDGHFCTSIDACDGSGACVGGGPPPCDDSLDCTDDSCDGMGDTCVNTPKPDTCLLFGFTCAATGDVSPSSSCLVCDPSRNTSDYSPVMPATPCSVGLCTSGQFVAPGACDTSGNCVVQPVMPCPTGVCASANACVLPPCTAGSCTTGFWCAPSMQCEMQRANGDGCTADAQCRSGACVDGTCCTGQCSGICTRCDVGFTAGTCTPVPANTDPDGECAPAGYCDGMGGCANRDGGVSIPPDAGFVPMVDAGGTVMSRGGCGCAVPEPRQGGAWLLAGLVGLFLVRRRTGSKARRSVGGTPR